MSLAWSSVKALSIPVGGTARDVKRVTAGGVTLWEKPSQNPYITDGLVAWYDGIWNTGVGTHSDTTQTWYDISGNGNNATWQCATGFSASAWHWMDDGFDFSNTDADRRYWKTGAIPAALRTAINSGTATLEIVLMRTATRNSPYVHAAPNATVDNLIFTDSSGNFQTSLHRTWNNGRVSVAGASNAIRSYSCTWSGLDSAGAIYVNGAYSKAGATPESSATDASASTYIALGGFAAANLTGGGRNLLGRIYCVRIYNRALSAPEVVANYASDARRFGL